MSILDVFRADPFTATAMTAHVERNPFIPTGLGELNLFEPMPVRTTTVMVTEKNGSLTVIPTSARGAPPTERVTDRRKARYFEIPRLAHADTIYAHELQNIVEYTDPVSGETMPVLKQVQSEVAVRMSGPTGLQASMEYTWERHRLGAIQGVVKDANNDTIYDWFSEFDVTPPTEVAFDLTASTPVNLREKCASVVRGMMRAAKGAFTPGTRIYALCGDQFWDQLIKHPDVVDTYKYQEEARELRKGTAFKSFDFADITWFNYRGSDDTTTIGVTTSKVRFFPVGAPGIFKVAYGPGESFDFVNQPGRPQFVVTFFDRDRNAWWRQELYSYPLFMCTRPEVLYSGRAGA